MSLLSVESEGHDGCAELEEKTEVAKADISHRSMESEGGDDDEREVAKQEKNAKSNRAAAECRVLVRQPGGSTSISLNLDELRACHELRLELPFEDLAVGLPPGFSDMQVNTVAGDSPLVDWKINSPEEDPVKMKERIKVWVQAVALSYACHHRSK